MKETLRVGEGSDILEIWELPLSFSSVLPRGKALRMVKASYIFVKITQSFMQNIKVIETT